MVLGKGSEGKPGDRVILTSEGRSWCELNYPDWLSDCQGTITRWVKRPFMLHMMSSRLTIRLRVDKDGRMCDVKWDDRDRLYHYHTVLKHAFALFHDEAYRCVCRV